METVNVYEAKSQLSRLIDRAAAGEDVLIARNGRPVARLTQLGEGARPRRLGVLAGSIFTMGPTMTICHCGRASASARISSRSIRSSITPK